ncbi:hypothetical protein BpHYR1_023839 [Brachionus plicatilis]|uniref:Uncharacterized protein n=1 Tax=Brachionus plicatilis TaxID=10195 RepID=A0A3M7S4P5_BRAPC|nr:hypothetical protein BpHYR1_023839 [Brachionus plicatilis]
MFFGVQLQSFDIHKRLINSVQQLLLIFTLDIDAVELNNPVALLNTGRIGRRLFVHTVDNMRIASGLRAVRRPDQHALDAKAERLGERKQSHAAQTRHVPVMPLQVVGIGKRVRIVRIQCGQQLIVLEPVVAELAGHQQLDVVVDFIRGLYVVQGLVPRHAQRVLSVYLHYQVARLQARHVRRRLVVNNVHPYIIRHYFTCFVHLHTKANVRLGLLVYGAQSGHWPHYAQRIAALVGLLSEVEIFRIVIGEIGQRPCTLHTSVRLIKMLVANHVLFAQLRYYALIGVVDDHARIDEQFELAALLGLVD